MMYLYGMRLRGFSIGCQPMDGLIERYDDNSGKYHDLLVYDRPLTDSELTDYELDFIERETTEEQMNLDSERRLFAGR